MERSCPILHDGKNFNEFGIAIEGEKPYCNICGQEWREDGSPGAGEFENIKEFLADQLEGIIQVNNGILQWVEKVPWRDVLETEMDYIIRKVEEKLSNDKSWSSNPGDYPTWIYSNLLLEAAEIKLWDNGTPLKSPFDIATEISKIPWQTRAKLLKETFEIRDRNG